MREGMEHKDPEIESPQILERDSPDYDRFLGIKSESINSGNILNIGSGVTGRFDKQIADQGANVISVSPYFASKGVGGEVMRAEYTEGSLHALKRKVFDEKAEWPNALAAWAEELPIKDESINNILALYSVPLYAEKEMFPAMFNELHRVLVQGGSATLYPVSKSMLEAIVPVLEDLDVQYHTVPVEETSTDKVFPGETPMRLQFYKNSGLNDE